MVSQELREYEQARKDYQQAFQIFIEFDDRYSQARTYHQLGMVAQELREFEQARKDYQQALQICIAFDDSLPETLRAHNSQAPTYFVLGSLAEAEEKRSEARANF